MMIRICKHYIPWNLAFLVIAESVIVFGSVYASAIIKQFLAFQPILESIDCMYSKALVITLTTSITFYIVDLYDSQLHLSMAEFFVKISTCLIIIFFIISSINFLVPSLQLDSIDYLLSLTIFVPVIICFRFFYYWVINISKQKLIILGVNDIARNIAQELADGSSHGFEVQGLIAENFLSTDDVLDYSVLGGKTESQTWWWWRFPRDVVCSLIKRF
jgi:FlaA1/EpsC-like NDP-sugar epimerase